MSKRTTRNINTSIKPTSGGFCRWYYRVCNRSSLSLSSSLLAFSLPLFFNIIFSHSPVLLTPSPFYCIDYVSHRFFFLLSSPLSFSLPLWVMFVIVHDIVRLFSCAYISPLLICITLLHKFCHTIVYIPHQPLLANPFSSSLPVLCSVNKKNSTLPINNIFYKAICSHFLTIFPFFLPIRLLPNYSLSSPPQSSILPMRTLSVIVSIHTLITTVKETKVSSILLNN